MKISNFYKAIDPLLHCWFNFIDFIVLNNYNNMLNGFGCNAGYQNYNSMWPYYIIIHWAGNTFITVIQRC